MKKVLFVAVFVFIAGNIFFHDLPLLYSNLQSNIYKSGRFSDEFSEFKRFLSFVDKSISKKQDIYFSLSSQYHQILANYYLYPRRVYVNPRDIMWTNTVVSYETIPNIIYILEGEKTDIKNILWLSGGEGIEGQITSKRDIKLARIDFLMSTEKWHKPGAIVLEIYDNNKLLKKITNEKIVYKEYQVEGKYILKNEEELLSSSKFLLNLPIPLAAYKEYSYKLYFRGDAGDSIGLSQEVIDDEVETKKLIYQLHPYYKLFKSYGLNKSIYNRG